jgi:hypothetical protein
LRRWRDILAHSRKLASYFSIRADVPPVPEHGITRWRAEIQDF